MSDIGDFRTTVPVGAVEAFAANAVPNGWLKANGAAVSRTVYARLFSIIGTVHGAGDGTTTFNLPDLRGEFIRGFDDGRGVDSGRGFASAQNHQSDNLRDFIAGASQGTPYASGVGTIPANGSYSSIRRVAGNGGPDQGHIQMRLQNRETRPENVALLACIKY